LKPLLSLGLIFIIGCQTTSELSSRPTHMLQLICDGTKKTNFQSRLAVLDIGHSDYDFGFATAHAIPPERPCKVKDFQGNSEKVDFIKLANNYKSGEQTDWAIIRFDKISTKSLARYKLAPIDDSSLTENNEFYFAKARGLPENSQACKLSILDFSNGRRRATHDCRAIPGQSGSPITQVVKGEHLLVGLHIGHLWMQESPETGGTDRKGYINLLDQDTVQEIQGVISENQN